jgi:transposase
VPVRLKEIRIERPRRFGDVYLALALWRGIGLEQLCERLLPAGKERVAWSSMAAVRVAAWFCEPSSELHIAEDWYRRTALCDLLQLPEEQVNKDRLYRSLDHLLVHKAALEAHLAQRCGELFAVQNEVLLYDVPSTYFEGHAPRNPQAQRGHSRDHRPDCKQVCIALVVTFDGFPLGYEVFAGNTHDSRTLQTIVATMEARHGVLGRVWIADPRVKPGDGMASARNLAWLRETGRRTIVGAPKAKLKRFAAALAEPDGWRVVQEGVEVKLAHDPDTAETVILCRSADRRSKEQAMHDRFSQRIEAALQRLAGRIARAKKPLDAAVVNRQIGRLMQRNQRAAARFVVQMQPDDSRAGFHLLVARSAGFDDWAALSEGAYLLRSNIADWTDRQLWKAYIQLTQAEAAFRIQKDQVNVRPIWHQREDRVQAHILVCFLAFVLWKCLEMWQSRAGLGNAPRTILEELARIQSHDVVLPTTSHGVIRLRCVTQPDAAQAALLDRLGLALPKRMRRDEQELPILSLSA